MIDDDGASQQALDGGGEVGIAEVLNRKRSLSMGMIRRIETYGADLVKADVPNTAGHIAELQVLPTS